MYGRAFIIIIEGFASIAGIAHYSTGCDSACLFGLQNPMHVLCITCTLYMYTCNNRIYIEQYRMYSATYGNRAKVNLVPRPCPAFHCLQYGQRRYILRGVSSTYRSVCKSLAQV